MMKRRKHTSANRLSFLRKQESFPTLQIRSPLSRGIQKKERQDERGSALWFILIAIVLLGSLTVMLSRTSDSSNETGDYEQTQISISKMMRYSNSLKTAVETLRSRGCSENDLTFDNAVVAGYSNLNAPTDNSCHIFDTRGAGLTWNSPAGEVNDGSEWIITSGNTVIDVGCNTASVACTDLLLILPNVTLNNCIRINNLLEVENPSGAPPVDTNNTVETSALFDGSFAYSEAIVAADDVLDRVETACIEGSVGNYLFYDVLLRR